MVFKGRLLVMYPQALSRLTFLNQLSINTLMFAANAAMLANMLVLARFSSFVGFLLTIAGIIVMGRQRDYMKLFNSIQSWGCKYKINIALLTFCVIGSVFFLDYAASPAQAQFFNQTEGWLRSSFPATAGGGGGGTDIYKLIFNTLRAIFVIYLAIALVQVIAAARNDEDWQTLARTPLRGCL